jgi:opacity protein-like surface antigen
MARLVMAAMALIVVIGLIFSSSLALAQDATPKVQVFGGYSLVHADTGKLTGITLDVTLREPSNTFAVPTNFSGWNAEGQYNLGRWLGLAADFSGHSGAPIKAPGAGKVSGLANLTAYSYLFGPVVTYRTSARMTPFAHALFGYDRSSLSASTPSGLSTPVSSAATNYTDFALALGGGLDYYVIRHVSVRVGQLDWFHTSVNLNTFYNNAFGPNLFQGLATRERNLRFSAGIVVAF